MITCLWYAKGRSLVGSNSMKSHNHEGDARAEQRLALALLAYLQAGGSIAWPVERAKGAPRRFLLRRLAFGSVVTLGVIGLTWVGGNVYGMHYALQGTSLPARSSDALLQQMVQRKAQAYRLRIMQPDGTQQAFSLQDIGLRLHTGSTIDIARQQQHTFASRLQWWRPIPLKLVTTTDTKALEAFIALRATVTAEPARDASLTLADGAVKLTDGTAGKQYGLDNPTHTVLEAASNLQAKPLRMHIVAQQPAVTAQALAGTKARLDAALKQSVIFNIDGDTVRPSSQEVASWIALAADQPNKTVQISVNTDSVQAYVNKLAGSRSHPPRAQVSLAGGGVIPGNGGVTITNKEGAVATITQNLLAGQGLHVDLPAKRTGFKTITASAAGKWIEVDLTNKRMYTYQQANLVRSFLVSAGAPATPTPTGTYAIYAKYARQTMTGANADGSRYNQPNVPWINYFYRDYAIHGNYWRPSSYFGNINSSHGCVGITPSEAAWVYTWAPVGTPVVIHT